MIPEHAFPERETAAGSTAPWTQFREFVDGGGLGETRPYYSPDVIRERYFYGIQDRVQPAAALAARFGDELDGWKRRLGADPVELRRDGESWFEVMTGDGLEHGEPVGRFFLNPQLVDTPAVFGRALILADENDAALSLKIIDEPQLTAGLSARPDKLVLYVNPPHALTVLEIVHQLSAEFGDNWQASKVTTSLDVADARGLPMAGISFAEDPVNYVVSYSQVRSKILADMMYRQLSDADFEPGKMLSELCAVQQVDVRDFAFNVGGRVEFAEIASALEQPHF